MQRYMLGSAGCVRVYMCVQVPVLEQDHGTGPALPRASTPTPACSWPQLINHGAEWLPAYQVP